MQSINTHPALMSFPTGPISQHANLTSLDIPSGQSSRIILGNEDSQQDVRAPYRRSLCCNASVIDVGINIVCDYCGEYAKLMGEE